MPNKKPLLPTRTLRIVKPFRRYDQVAYMNAGVFTMLEDSETPGAVRKYKKGETIRLKLVFESGLYGEEKDEHNAFEVHELEALIKQGLLEEAA